LVVSLPDFPVKPKKRGPDQRVPVISRAMAERDGQICPRHGIELAFQLGGQSAVDFRLALPGHGQFQHPTTDP